MSDPLPGSRHDTHCLKESGALDGIPGHSWIGDKGYLGLEVILTPIRKPANDELLDGEKEFNTQINKIRYVIERTIANFKTWRVTHTDYRRPLNTFAETISTVIALQFFNLTT
ncbi:MAG: transposase family protein [Acidobacteria bacterium]|nr:transposase family protein [Acidobacteriota bacterium]